MMLTGGRQRVRSGGAEGREGAGFGVLVIRVMADLLGCVLRGIVAGRPRSEKSLPIAGSAGAGARDCRNR
jgi:hypothetical protein